MLTELQRRLGEKQIKEELASALDHYKDQLPEGVTHKLVARMKDKKIGLLTSNILLKIVPIDHRITQKEHEVSCGTLQQCREDQRKIEYVQKNASGDTAFVDVMVWLATGQINC